MCRRPKRELAAFIVYAKSEANLYSNAFIAPDVAASVHSAKPTKLRLATYQQTRR